MEKFKMSLANVPGKLSRAEMKNVMAGTRTDACIKDGEDCAMFTNCCNECLATFKCGKKKEEQAS